MMSLKRILAVAMLALAAAFLSISALSAAADEGGGPAKSPSAARPYYSTDYIDTGGSLFQTRLAGSSATVRDFDDDDCDDDDCDDDDDDGDCVDCDDDD